MTVELYVRRRRSPQDDARSGTIAEGRCRITIGDQVIDVAEDRELLIEIDELTEHKGVTLEAPSRVMAELAKQVRAEEPDLETQDPAAFFKKTLEKAIIIDPRFGGLIVRERDAAAEKV
jgi:hypothetical protein